MKLPFAFNLKFVFRLLLPGFILSLGILPVLKVFLDKTGITTSIEFPFIACVILTGWLVVILDMHIYMIYEGRRYWPSIIKRIFLKFEQQRLSRLLKKKDLYKETNNLKYREVSVELRRFPMDENNGQYYAEYPTRFGNLLSSYEIYPSRVYGMDSSFYWYRIMLIMDDENREHVDSEQALADSTIYMSTALFITGLISMSYALMKFYKISWIPFLPEVNLLICIAFFNLVASYLLYRVSIYIHANFGETFKSVFDIYRDKISVENVIKDVSDIIDDVKLLELPHHEKYKIAWRYLHNYRIKTADGIVAPSKYNKKTHNTGP